MDNEQLPSRVTQGTFVGPKVVSPTKSIPVFRYVLFLLLIGILEGAVTLGVISYKRSLQKDSSQSTAVLLPSKSPAAPLVTLIPTTVLMPFKTPTPSIASSSSNSDFMPTPPVISGAPQNGYSRITVKTERGSFSIDVGSIVMSVDSKSVTIVVDSANDTLCTNNCPTITLSDYIGKFNGFAGISGTRFCPADDTACSDKINAYTNPIYNTRTHTWINNSPANWANLSLIYKNSSGVAFAPTITTPTTYTGATDITAAISGRGLLNNGVTLVDEATLPNEDKIKTSRSGIGIKPNIVYIVVAQNADTADMASIFKEITATSALQLDAGLSPTLRFGNSSTAAQRKLPNAVIFSLH